jgi:hypothetical protein
MTPEEHNGGQSPSESPTKVDHSFDDLARALAEGSISRRRALKLFAGSAIAALIPSRALAGGHGKPQECNDPCICHRPPGNPQNAQTLCLPKEAREAHLKNHSKDTCGPCGGTTSSTSTTSTTETPTTSTTETPTTSTSTTTPMCLPNGSSPCDADSECCSGLCDVGMCSACQDANDCPTNQCQQATCTNGVCGVENVPDGTPCDDNNECTVDVCVAGVCVSTVVDCSGEPCTTDDDCCLCATCVENECQQS